MCIFLLPAELSQEPANPPRHPVIRHQVAIQSLIDAVPQMQDVANVTGEQVVNIGSQDMNDQVWLTLAKRINELLAQAMWTAS